MVGLQALVMPLDFYTWNCLEVPLLSFVLLSVTNLVTDSKTRNQATEHFILTWQWILSSLSGQYHGTSSVLRIVSHFPVIIVIFVLSFYLLGTVFYQGSMFSSLVAVIPPNLPSTLEQIVESKLQVITTSSVELREVNKFVSILNHIMIDDVSRRAIDSLKLQRALPKLKALSKFVLTKAPFLSGTKISAEHNVEFEDHSFNRVRDIFAIIDLEHHLEEMLAGLVVKREPYVVRDSEPPVFYLDMPIHITRGFMNSVIPPTIGQLAQSGLYKLWDDLDGIQKLITNIKNITSRVQYRRVVVEKLFGARREIVFDESKQVSIFALQADCNALGIHDYLLT
ncbi:hypothetical protein Fcan01_28560 [Folsomia candida]|uniref:Uncharacterized protein n=1 Tax=Folsomia candida TaxID=158441 RepID=A0A226CT82_FOLCA|nr:hypothetical protein Fcan01_28560 [Folsomia candida]